MMVKRINHNNLLPWFTDDHGTLPKAYLKSCEKFFKKIKQRGLTKKEERLGWITRGHEPEASSNKRQVVALHRPGTRVKNRFNRKV